MYGPSTTLCLVGKGLLGGGVSWQDTSSFGFHEGEIGLTINFPLYGEGSKTNAERYVSRILSDGNYTFLAKKGTQWIFDGNALNLEIPNFSDAKWLKGKFFVESELVIERGPFESSRQENSLRFILTVEMTQQQNHKKIFLSHKGIDKPRVRRFAQALRAVGLHPWLDEDAMHAGTELERGLISGFDESCAAVFFITTDFEDRDYLASEINYAIAQKREKAENFSIITLVFKNADGKTGPVPKLLRQYVWKEPDCDLNALLEIIRSLPIAIEAVDWKFKN